MTLPDRIKINDVEYVRVDAALDQYGYMSYRTIPPTFIPYNKKPLDALPFETYPENLPVMTYVAAVKTVERINVAGLFGHNDWTIPTIEQLRLQYQHKDTIGGFITEASGSVCPDWYWSSTEYRDNSSHVLNVRFSDGIENWSHKDDLRLSCRPVRS